MRLLKRNMRKFQVNRYEGRTPILTETGLDTGEFTEDRTDFEIKANLSPASSLLIQNVFGKVNDSEYVVYTRDLLLVDDIIVLNEFGEDVKYKVKYRKEFLNHNTYGLVTYGK